LLSHPRYKKQLRKKKKQVLVMDAQEVARRLVSGISGVKREMDGEQG
jgi:hypothetical protein